MTEKQQAEMADADKTTEPGTGEVDEGTETGTETETVEGSEEERSQVTPREKELRRLLRENERKLAAAEKAEDDRRKAEMTENERLKEELADREAKLAEVTRKDIARAAGLDEDLASRLRGDTDEELAEDAKRLAALLTPKAPEIPGASDVGLGTPGGGNEVESDPVKAHRAATANTRY